MRTTFSKSIALVLLSFVLTACGDLFMKKSEGNKGALAQFAQCDSDTKALSKIFTENIRGDLLCLEQNLNLFIDLVETDRPGNLSYTHLKIYINDVIKDIDPDVVEALGGIFEVNSLIFGDDQNYINKNNVRKLVQLFIDINRVVVQSNVYEYFMAKEGTISFAEHNRRKAKIFSAFSYIASRFNQEIKPNSNVINFVDFLERFKNLDNNVVLTNSTKLLYLKRMFLGGQEKVLTAFELKRFARMLPDIGKVVFDLAHHDEIEHSEHQAEEVILTMREDAEAIVKNLYFKGQDFVNVMTLDNVFDTIKIFTPEYLKYKKYTNEILKIKGALLANNSTPVFNSHEVMIMADELLLKSLNKGAYFFRMYAENADVLNEGNVISNDLKGIVKYGSMDEVYKEDFNKIVKKYRYFKGKSFSASFNHKIERNPLGIYHVALMEDLISRLMEAYGSNDADSKGKFKFSQEQLEKMMLEYKAVLEGEGVTDPGRTKNTAETITLMSTLFQHQSDGDADIEVAELTEFGLELLSSSSIAGMADKFFQGECQIIDDKNRYEPECYRRKFAEMMSVEKEGTSIGDKLGKLNRYLKDSNTNVDEYLKISEVFTRSCTHFDNGEEVPMNEGELFLVLTGLMAIEQTIIKFDTNDDNILQGREIEKAFPIYRSAIRALLPKGFKDLAKRVFHYMIKNEKIPSTGAVLLMRTNPFPPNWKKVNATRKTLAIILKTLSEESPANAENPFPCETLR